MPRTVLAFHAHPDDEALLTAGTIARAVAQGHRAVVVVATDGDLGLAAGSFTAGGRLGERRMRELRSSATSLGVSRVEHLGYADSGLGPELAADPPGRTRFVRADIGEAAGLLAGILREEGADVLLTYDANGGYGHRDHVRVHEVGARAAELAGTPRLLQATVPRDTICRAIAVARRIYRFPPEFDPASFERAFSPRAAITHRVDVRRYAAAKRASMRAHASQASADEGADRTLAAFLRIPRPLFDLVFGREWFIDPAHPPQSPSPGTSLRACRDQGLRAQRLGGSVVSMPGKSPRGIRQHEPAPVAPWRPTSRHVLQSVIGLALAVALVVWGLPYFAQTSWRAVFDTLGNVGPATAAGLLGLMTLGLWSYTFTLTGSLPGLSHPRALVLNVCGSSVGNLLPGGGAAGVAATYAMCRSWGFTRRDISTSVIVSGVWNILARVALPVLGIGALLVNSTDLPAGVVQGGVIGAAVGVLLLSAFIAALVSQRAATWIGSGVDHVLRPLWRRTRHGREISVDDLIRDLRARVTAVVRTGWLSMTLGLLGYFGVWFVLFWACMHTVGVTMEITHLFAAYAVGRLLTAVGITPGGLGVTESGTAAVLVAWGTNGTSAAAGVVLFTVCTHLMEIPLGAVGWVAWGLSPKHHAPDTVDPVDSVDPVDPVA